MGEMCQYQPLTTADRVTVFIYRAGIVLSTLIICSGAAVASLAGDMYFRETRFLASGAFASTVILSLYFSVGLSVFFIHLYVGKFHRMLKKLYFAAVACLAMLFLAGEGNPVAPLITYPPYAAVLLLPLSGCLGFITAKEAFCFKLIEGYILALLMPFLLVLYSVGGLDHRSMTVSLIAVSALLVLFLFRKVFMPMHCDIGDKSAYQP